MDKDYCYNCGETESDTYTCKRCKSEVCLRCYDEDDELCLKCMQEQ